MLEEGRVSLIRCLVNSRDGPCDTLEMEEEMLRPVNGLLKDIGSGGDSILVSAMSVSVGTSNSVCPTHRMYPVR